MVRGLGKFREYFSEDNMKYVFIGGTACSIIAEENGIEFRATHDLDIVLLLEVLDEAFVTRFIEFVKEGGYSHRNKGRGKEEFYRFTEPTDTTFPEEIELFSKRPEYLKKLETTLAPIHVSDKVDSLSAIVLDEDYYRLLKQGAVEVDGVTILGLQYLILFKMKAFIDLRNSKLAGERIDSKKILKHKRDVLRLSVMLEPGRELAVTDRIQSHMEEFIFELVKNPIKLMELGIRDTTYDRLVDNIKKAFVLEG